MNNSLLSDVIIGKTAITSVPENLFLNCARMERIEINLNQITEVPIGFLRPLAKLKILRMHQNAISFLSPMQLAANRALTEVDFRSNKLRELPADLLRFSPLLTIVFDLLHHCFL